MVAARMTAFLDLNELRLFLSDSAPEEIELADPDQVEFEARRLLLLADTYRELAAQPKPSRYSRALLGGDA